MTNLTVYLLKDTIKTVGDAVNDGVKAYIISDGKSEIGTLLVKKRSPLPPKWSKLFDGFIDIGKLGLVQSSSAAFFVKVDKRMFVLTFGSGRFILRSDAYEERFGLLVTINSVKSDALRSIDKRAFIDDQNSRVQTGQAAAAFDFGVDVERDLVRGIVGYPHSDELGRKLAGADALTVTIDVELSGIKKLLRRYLKAFESKDYQAHFPWIDKIRQLHPKGKLVEELNHLLIEKLKTAWKKNGHVDGCWLSVPDIVDWGVVRGFKFTRSPKEGVSSDLHLPGLVQAFPEADLSVDFLRIHHAMAVNEEERPENSWPIFRCLQCEIDRSGKSFVLSAGHWFEIETDFVKEIDGFYSKIPSYNGALPLYKHKDEEEYNKELVASSGGAWSLMDRKLLKVGGIHDKVEFCDVYQPGVLLHIKHYGSSNVLGHLFSQGLVSGELLKGHAQYVDLANAHLVAGHKLPAGNTVPRDVSGYKIVFCVISQSSKPGLHLPFFSKVVLKSVCTRLRELGYGGVMLSKIECDKNFVLTKKLAAKKQKKKKNS